MEGVESGIEGMMGRRGGEERGEGERERLKSN